MINALKHSDTTEFYKKMLVLGIPIIIQNLVSTTLNMVDTVMISSQGEQALAAVAIANKFLFILIVILFGIFSGMSIFISQYYGAKDYTNIHHVLGMGISLGVAVCILFFGLALAVPEVIMRVFINDSEVIRQGVIYLRIVSFSYLAMTVSFAFSHGSRNVHRTKVPMASSIIALCLNTGINYLLIEGHFGFPSLGVAGAAIATLISRVVEFLILLLFIYADKSHPLRANFSELFGFTKELFFKIVKVIIPVIINEGLWVVGTSVYYIAYGILGAKSVAAMQVSMTLTDFCWAIFMGIGSSSAVLIGNEIGRGDARRSYNYSKAILFLGVAVAVVVGGFMGLLSPFLGLVFKLESETLTIAKYCVWVMALYMPIRSFNYMMFISILRSGGDTKFCMIVDALTVWLVGVPLTFIAVKFLPVGIALLLAFSYSEEIIKAFIVFKRFLSKKWMNNLVDVELVDHKE